MAENKYIAKSNFNCEVLWLDSPENTTYTTDETLEFILQPNSSRNIIIVQNENEKSTHNTKFNIELKENSQLKLTIITLNGNVNNDIHTQLTGKGANCELNGLYLGGGERVINTTVNLIHKVGECKSEQLFKGILGGKSRSFFQGDVIVERDAQKTEAYQANNNLLTSPDAKAVSKPELIIYADDVKCSHGSTVGTLGTEELFYMRSRGITLEEAQLLQQQAFASAVLEKISDVNLREQLTNLVVERLR